MSYNDTGVTRVTVILDKPADWEPWFQLRREKALIDGIWKYHDISKPKDELPKLEEPVRPLPSDVRAGATAISQLDAIQQGMLRDLLQDWRQDRTEYMKTRQKEGELLLDISRTIATRHLYLINGKDEIYDRLITIKKHFAPSAATRSRELVVKYRALQERPQSQDLEQWLDDWMHITNQCREAVLPETTGYRAQEDFLAAIRTIAPEWAGSSHHDLIIKETTGRANEIQPLEDYIAQFRIYHRRIGPSAASFGTFASLNMTAHDNPPQKEERSSKLAQMKPKCVCRGMHWYKDCWYLFPDHPKKPDTFQPNSTTQQQVAEALKDPEQVKKINRLLAKAGKKIEGYNKALKLDSGKESQQSSTSFVTYRSFSAAAYVPQKALSAIINRWILDPGSNLHICNSRGFGWRETRLAKAHETVLAGDSTLAIQAWGEVTFNVNRPYGICQIQLSNVALVEGFLTNVVSLSRCRENGMHFDSGRDVVYHKHLNNVICFLDYRDGHWIIDADENDRLALSSFVTTQRQAHKPSREDRRPIAASHVEAHEMFAHAGKEAIDHLSKNVRGIQLDKDTRAPRLRECETCIESKSTAQISRRQTEDQATRPFYRIVVDLVQLIPTGETCYNGDRYLLHAVCEYSKWHEAATLANKTLPVVIATLKALLNKIERQYKYTVAVLKIDGDRGYGLELYRIARQAGLKIELRAPDTPEQLGAAEQAGNVIITKARSLRIQAGLPKSLSNELVITATRITNVTPTKSIQWKTPYELVYGRQPSVAHFSQIGCKAYVLDKKLKKADKLESRTFVGYLVGYDSSNIFRVWLPKKNRVIRVRDVIFQKSSLFRDNTKVENEAISQEETEILDISHIEERDFQEDMTELQQHEAQMNEEIAQSIETIEEREGTQFHKDWRSLPTPEPSDRSTTLPYQEADDGRELRSTEDQQIIETAGDQDTEEISTVASRTDGPLRPVTSRRGRPRKAPSAWPKGWTNPDDYIPDRLQNNAPRMADPAVGTSSNIVTGKRARKPVNQALVAYYRSFAVAINTTAPTKLIGDTRKLQLHRDQLPEPPKRWKDLKNHPFGAEFTKAAQVELNDCWKKHCFKSTEVTVATAETEVLPLMWVFTYKFDEEGYLYKFKARICVRGDLQEIWGETYAATLAMKVFRALIALAAAFGLQMLQSDAMNAFLNAKLPRKLYCYTPEGFSKELGQLLELQRALYGLKEAPLLWYQELSSTLEKLGLKPVPGVPCLYTSDRLIVFFYVDDIVVLVHPLNMGYYETFKQKLLSTYEIRELGELQWFLGIRVIRQEATQSISLVQDSFIDKIATKFDLKSSTLRYPDVPLKENNLAPSNEEANAARTHKYQQLVGSLAYISTSTRPDVARAHSVLARHLQNPGQKHLYAAYHVWRYLIGTKHLAIKASVASQQSTISITSPEQIDQQEPIFFGASDAAFADEPDTRRSSQGYIFKLYGMPIDWKATVQQSVTKSTTEAELLSLSLAGSEMRWWQRLF